MQNCSFSYRTWASLRHQTAFDQKLDESSTSQFHLHSLNEWFEAHCTKPKICFRTAFTERYDFYNILCCCDNLIIGLCESPFIWGSRAFVSVVPLPLARLVQNSRCRSTFKVETLKLQPMFAIRAENVLQILAFRVCELEMFRICLIV